MEILALNFALVSAVVISEVSDFVRQRTFGSDADHAECAAPSSR
jgi:hypothetical protein